MLVTEQSLALNETVNQLGFGSVEDFALQKAKETLTLEIAVCKQNIAMLSEKYGMNYNEFYERFHELPQDLFEKEEDSADWKAEIKLLDILTTRLSRLD